ncbi:Clostripain family [uncultured Clostridium sp.]|nr:Clostripain family [uncultured Clostridium sp.]
MRYTKWTVLIYANGNNELEPEITKAIEEFKMEHINDTFNIVVQLARANEELVQKLRGPIYINQKERWSGVRRYIINENGIHEVEILENVNMADSKTLYNFLLWGVNNYPSDYIMTVLSGHGAGFIGAMTDFTQEKPYLMSLDSLVNVFYNLYKTTKKKIEVLLLDSCYMNLIEIWHELANVEFNPIKYLVIASENVKIDGIPYLIFIRYLQEEVKKVKNTKEKLIDAIKKFNKNDKIEEKLILVNLEKNKFEELKICFDNIAKIIIENNINIEKVLKKELSYKKTNPFINIIYLYNIINSQLGYTPSEINYILELVKDIVIYPSMKVLSNDVNSGPSIYMTDSLSEFEEFRRYYKKLLFLSNNNWIVVLDRNEKLVAKESEYIKNYNILEPPIVLKNKYIISSILEQRSNISVEEAIEILKKLGWY